MADASELCKVLDITLKIPRVAGRQQHRSNPPATTDLDFWKRSIVIPYLDSLITSLKTRFPQENLPAFSLFVLHPQRMLGLPLEEVRNKMKSAADFYNLDTLQDEVELWYSLWRNKDLPLPELEKLELAEVVKEAATFFPSIEEALTIALTLPCTTSSVERSFSTLRRVKTWLRSTMGQERLRRLCLLSSHREMVSSRGMDFEKDVLNRFAENPRRLSLL